MNNKFTLVASITMLLSSTSAIAQGALVGVDTLDDRIDVIQENISDDFDNANVRDRSLNQYSQGWDGSVSLGFSVTSGNTNTTDLNLAGRFRYGDGPWNHTFGFGAEFAEDNGTRNKEEIYATYDVNRYFNDRFYVFGLGSVSYDGFDSNKIDAFLGVGPGYRVINQADLTWRIQAGPGFRFIEDQTGSSTTEIGGILSSRYNASLTDTISLSMDTDALFSQEDVVLTNDFGVNFKVSDSLSTRISYRTEWDSNPLPGRKNVDSGLGVSLIYGF